ncbi:hypothetical protein SH528x_002210 [Novipirellula sp. SH528]|uniref:hypothetical protein n=1 Tax=Novipirellula sp. SH528 TaxID=3454466 RepID=UPI003FA11858
MPELGMLEDRVRQMIIRLLDEIEQLQPEWYRGIKREIFKVVIERIIEWGKIDLSDAETAKYRNIWDRYPSRDEFPPLRNGINLFLLGLDECDVVVTELGVAANVLGMANNIDSSGQPSLINVHDRDKVILPFIDP